MSKVKTEINIKRYIILLTILAFVLISIIRYIVQLPSTNPKIDPDLKIREVDTFAKLLFNGFLGHYFRFYMFGFFSWLALPIIGIAVISFFKLTNWQRAFIIVYILASILIGLKGYFNYRYQATLIPITFILILYGTHLIIKKYNISFKYLTLFIVFILLNSSKYLLSSGAEQNEEPKNKKKKSPYPVVDYLNQSDFTENIFVNELSFFYYYTNKKGVYYSTYADSYYDNSGIRKKLTSWYTTDEIPSVLLDSLNCKYILTADYKNELNPDLLKVVEKYGKLLFKDRIFYVYEIKKEPVTKEEKMKDAIFAIED